MLPTEGGEHIFKKIDKILKRRVCQARRAERKQHVEHEIHKSGCVLHTTVFVDQALEGKNAQVTDGKQYFDGRLKCIKRERNEQRSDTNE